MYWWKKKLCAAAAAAIFASPAFAASPLLKEIEDAFVRLHSQVGPAVVNIEIRGGGGEVPDEMNDLFHFFNIPQPEGGAPGAPEGRMPRTMASGSGFIYDKLGHIVTNNHVIAEADSITVRLYDGTEVPAEVIGTDPDTDLAVIKIEPAGDLPVATIGSSSTLQVGQFAIAIGSPRQLEGTVSFGHISALGREGLAGLRVQGLRFQNLIQTDAAINLGNSGGPLCNIDGEVVGINTAIIWGANSIGFAIPVDTAKNVIPKLISEGKVVRGFLGVGIDDVANGYHEAVELPDRSGAFVKEVRPDTPAAKAGIQLYDVIRKIEGEVVSGAADLVSKVSNFAPGSTVNLEVWRDKEAIEVPVELAEWQPGEQAAATTRDEEELLGMSVRNLDPQLRQRMGLAEETQGVIISDVKPNTPAENAQLTPGDIIIEVAQQTVSTVDELKKVVEEEATPGKSLLIRYQRGEGPSDITVLRIPK